MQFVKKYIFGKTSVKQHCMARIESYCLFYFIRSYWSVLFVFLDLSTKMSPVQGKYLVADPDEQGGTRWYR